MKKTNNPFAKTNLFHEKTGNFMVLLDHFYVFYMEFSKIAKGEISNEKKENSLHKIYNTCSNSLTTVFSQHIILF